MELEPDLKEVISIQKNGKTENVRPRVKPIMINNLAIIYYRSKRISLINEIALMLLLMKSLIKSMLMQTHIPC